RTRRHARTATMCGEECDPIGCLTRTLHPNKQVGKRRDPGIRNSKLLSPIPREIHRIPGDQLVFMVPRVEPEDLSRSSQRPPLSKRVLPLPLDQRLSPPPPVLLGRLTPFRDFALAE